MIQPHCKRSRFTNRLRHGLADIDLMLSTIVLLTILLLVMASMKIAVARLMTSRTASFEAFQDATAAQAPQYTGDTAVPPIQGFASLLPDLPNRVHDPHPTQLVNGRTGKPDESFTANVGGHAFTISPDWTFNCYPVGQNDQAVFQQWIQNYVDESHNGLTYPLGLAASWPP